MSYSTRNAAIASRIVSDLRAAGLSVWHDASHVIAGTRLREEINDAIKNSKVFVLLASRYSLKSRWVLNELDAAMLSEISSNQMLVMPVLIGTVDPAMLPGDLAGKRYVDLRFNFERKYSTKRPYILRSIRLLAGQIGIPPVSATRLVPDFLNRILSHHFDGSRETKDEVRADAPALALTYIDESWRLIDPKWKGNAEEVLGLNIFDRIRCRDLFRQQYGEFAMRQLAVFALDYVGISFSGGFHIDEFNKFIQIANLILGMFALRDFLVREQGLDLAVVEFTTECIAFLATGGEVALDQEAIAASFATARARLRDLPSA